MDYLEEKVDKDLTKIRSDVNEIRLKNETELNKLRGEVDTHLHDLQKVDDVATRLKEQVVSDIQSNKWSDMVKRQVDESLNSVADNLLEVKRSIQESTERQKNKGIRKVDEIISYYIMYLKVRNCEQRRGIKQILHSAYNYSITA